MAHNSGKEHEARMLAVALSGVKNVLAKEQAAPRKP